MDTVSRVPVTILKGNELQEMTKEFLVKVFPDLKKEEIVLDVFPKSVNRGLLNTMIKCTWKNRNVQPNAVIVRIKDNEVFSDLFTDILAEADFVQSLYERGVAPRVLAMFNNGFCYEYIEGEILTQDKLAEEPICWLIAKELAKIHSSDIDHKSIWKTPVMENQELTEKFHALIPTQLDDAEKNEKFKKELPPFDTVLREKEFLEKHIKDLGNRKLVLCHNDVRAENIIYNRETEKLSFVDFEALSYNYAEFEIAQHFLRYCGINPPDYSKYPSEDFQKKWIRIYLETYHEHKAKAGDQVSEKDVQTYFIMITKYKLLWLICNVIFAPLMESKFPVDGLRYGLESWKTYHEEKEATLAMRLPE